MQPVNRILQKHRAGVPALGTVTHLKSPTAIEGIAAAGMDYVMIDMEHSPMDISEVHACVTAADASGITPIVRIREISRTAVLRILDMGAMGVVVPGIESVSQVKELIQFAKFQPLGQRGYCMTRDGKWGYGESYAGGLEGYFAHSNRETLLLPQCETVGCLEHIEEITGMDGVDGVLIGPYDLSIAMGMAGQFDRPEFRSAIRRIQSACKKAGKIAIIFSGNEQDMQARLAEGFQNILFGLDILRLIESYRQVTNHFQTLRQREGNL